MRAQRAVTEMHASRRRRGSPTIAPVTWTIPRRCAPDERRRRPRRTRDTRAETGAPAPGRGSQRTRGCGGSRQPRAITTTSWPRSASRSTSCSSCRSMPPIAADVVRHDRHGHRRRHGTLSAAEALETASASLSAIRCAEKRSAVRPCLLRRAARAAPGRRRARAERSPAPRVRRIRPAHPSDLGSMISSGPPFATATTGTPSAIASSSTIPNGSSSDALTNTSMSCMYGATRSTCPVIVTAPSRSEIAAERSELSVRIRATGRTHRRRRSARGRSRPRSRSSASARSSRSWPFHGCRRPTVPTTTRSAGDAESLPQLVELVQTRADAGGSMPGWTTNVDRCGHRRRCAAAAACDEHPTARAGSAVASRSSQCPFGIPCCHQTTRSPMPASRGGGSCRRPASWATS